jgi:membrane-bound serine protease (ClpP class)
MFYTANNFFPSDPNAALLIALTGALGICAEFCAPGLIAPGVAGSVLVLLGLASLTAFPIHWPGAVLMMIAAAPLALGAKVATRGVAALAALTMAFGSAILIDTPDPTLHIRWTTVAAVFAFALAIAFLMSVAARARENKAVIRAEDNPKEDILNS